MEYRSCARLTRLSRKQGGKSYAGGLAGTRKYLCATVFKLHIYSEFILAGGILQSSLGQSEHKNLAQLQRTLAVDLPEELSGIAVTR